MALLQNTDAIRVKANATLNPTQKSSLGQFFTPAPIGLFMASLFNEIIGDVSLLDPGCGPGSLSAAFTEEAIRRSSALNSLLINAVDIDCSIEPFIQKTLNLCSSEASMAEFKLTTRFLLEDYVLNSSHSLSSFDKTEQYTHCIINPPYKKITSSSAHRKALRAAGIETVNLYAGFVALAIQQLQQGGELVAIIPRSFCNGPYYQSFRELVLKETAIQHIHIFDSRNSAFSDDSVLQENIILHLIKGGQQGDVTITSSPIADFHIDHGSSTVTASDMTTRTVTFNHIVNPNDHEKFIHIAANERDQAIIDRLSFFTSTLESLGVQVSTGPVVDFRLKEDLRQELEKGAVPLLYPTHLNDGIYWPKESKKPNAISVSERSKPYLWEHRGHFVVVRRFSSKEEKRRIIATPYDSSLPGERIGFDNKLNVFHIKKKGLDKELAFGLYVYLSSTLLDKYYRLFGGHTQINATDLRNIHYPTAISLRSMGSQVKSADLTQKQIDDLINRELFKVTGCEHNNPLNAQEKLDQASKIISLLGMPRAQQNERSALTLLALLNLHPESSWLELENPMMGVTPIMDWAKNVYGKEYAPNTRETFRRQTLHQFVDGGLALYNPDKPDRAVNSPKACYQIAPALLEVLMTYGTEKWEESLSSWLAQRETLALQYAAEREMHMIPLTLDQNTEIKLSPGAHSQLIHDIVVEFGPRFAPGAEVIYLGDTGAKDSFFKQERLAELGVTVNRKGKLPDVVLYWPKKDWLLLIESVTSHGPVDGKRHGELKALFKNAKPGLVYVTAFPDRKTMGKYLGDISWDTEVWVAEAPTHMIHFNGDRFLGPHD